MQSLLESLTPNMQIALTCPEPYEYATVTREADGAFYFCCDKFDSVAADAEGMAAKLTKWGFSINGFERR